jgi:deazaflavin-dependent oxidoreductase (nitroreductase family)
VMRPIARRLGGFGTVVHVGRVSGRRYETPVNVFSHDGGVVIALTYGAESDWVANVMSAGGCELIQGGATTRWVHPRLVGRSDVRDGLPAAVRIVLSSIGVDRFLVLDAATADS